MVDKVVLVCMDTSIIAFGSRLQLNLFATTPCKEVVALTFNPTLYTARSVPTSTGGARNPHLRHHSIHTLLVLHATTPPVVETVDGNTSALS